MEKESLLNTERGIDFWITIPPCSERLYLRCWPPLLCLPGISRHNEEVVPLGVELPGQGSGPVLAGIRVRAMAWRGILVVATIATTEFFIHTGTMATVGMTTVTASRLMTNSLPQ